MLGGLWAMEILHYKKCLYINAAVVFLILWLSDSTHYRDSLGLFMNKIVDCLTI